ncbi:psbV [Symbiodinium natans]|uniref:PsbV protein n=1 Tax=Symbiodinium natans TaxID=878477 RepID=A0A812R2K0_9DINO|nr:psbV [Symbiodinium natans]
MAAASSPGPPGPGSLSLPGGTPRENDRVSPEPLARRPGPSAGSASGPVTPAPGSPWQYQLNPRIRGRGVESPSPAGVRALSGTRTVVNAAARASYESAVLAAVRRQIEAFEEKVEKQISKLQVQGDKGKDASLTRLEEKVSAAEGLQPRVERRLAELSGNFKGLSDEMQAQIRRVDLLDDRRWEWRHQVEEEMQKKCQGYEQQVQAMASKLRGQLALEDYRRAFFPE